MNQIYRSIFNDLPNIPHAKPSELTMILRSVFQGAPQPTKNTIDDAFNDLHCYAVLKEN